MHGFPHANRGRWAAALVIVLAAWLAVRSLSPLHGHTTENPAPVPSRDRPDGPNLLILIGDDHAADTLGIAGDPHGATPRLDALARQGVRFGRTYCNSPVCTPSRQSIATGLLPHAVGVTRLATPLPDSAVTLGDMLSRAGYRTAAIGKMHFNSDKKHGFADRLDTLEWEKWLKAHRGEFKDRRKTWRPLHDPAEVWLNARVRPHGLPDAAMESTYLVDRARDFLRAHRSDPFAMVVGFPEPHSPFKFPDDATRRFAPDEFEAPTVTPEDRRRMPRVFRDLTPEQVRGIQAAYYTSLAYLDRQVGRVLDELESSGLAENTIVVYIGDNGYMRGRHGRFEKHCFFEQAVRIPFIVRWPKHLPEGRVVDDLVEGVDILPTVFELMGRPIPPGLHGESRAGLALGRAGSKGLDVVFSEYLENEEAMVVEGRLKLIVGTGRRRRQDGYVADDPKPGPYERLYDLQADPNEDHDLADDPTRTADRARLLDAMYDRMVSTQADPGRVPRDLGRLETIHRLLVPRD